MIGHRCACQQCGSEWPPELALTERGHPDHYSVRFGDVRYSVLVDGQPATTPLGPLVMECVVGDPGWYYASSLPIHLCPCGAREVCGFVSTGKVEVRQWSPDQTRPKAIA